jgi:drug/metabolite transporter (DMT)-like permease
METNARKAGDLRKLGNLLLILTAMIWGMAFVAQRKGMDTIEPITFAAARMALSTAVVGLVALLTCRRSKLPPADRARRRKASIAGGIGCGVFLALGSITQQMGLVTTTAGKAGFITAMYMLFVPVVNFVLFRRKTTWVVWLAVIIGVAGMYLLCVNEGFSLDRGDAMVFACALSFTGHILCCDRYAPLGNPIVISALQLLTAALICGAAAFTLEAPTWAKVASAAVPIAYCGVLSGGVGFTLQIVAQRFTDPTVASLLMSLESVFAAIAGALVLGERMRPRELVGCAVMFVAIVLVQLPVGRRGKESAGA